ncbi:MAG: hypothetical protein IKN49_05560, partial [Elusimicrobiaceae bacterium]|nr:hypothetical protein [Elusimicrobiaceae bacterium]
GVYLVCGEGTGGNSCSDNPNQEKCCNTAAPVCQYWNKSSSKCYTKSCQPGQHLDTSTCQCACDNTPASCGDSEWAYWYVEGNTCNCHCVACRDSYNGRNPRAGDTCYVEGVSGYGEHRYRMGTIAGDSTCNNCTRNITCEVPGLDWIENSNRYYTYAGADGIVATSHSRCTKESDVGEKLYVRQDGVRWEAGAQACKDVSIYNEPCVLVTTYVCTRTSPFSARWKEFQYGYPPCYPNC